MADGGQGPNLHARVDAVVDTMRDALLAQQHGDGHWCFELEADATIPSEYVLLKHFLGEPNARLEPKIAVYLRRIQNPDGGWPLFYRGPSDVSATVKAYFALKIIGDDIDASHMARARERVLAMGGAERANVFTRFALALFGQVPWRAAPVMPVEIMLLPKWFFFHLDKVSYWSRTVIAPLVILQSLKPQAANPRDVHIQELFTTPPERITDWHKNPTGKPIGELFLGIDKILQKAQALFPKDARAKAIEKAMAFCEERLNGEDGLGGIFPAMANLVMAYHVLGRDPSDPNVAIARASIEKLVVEKEDEAYVQPCFSPVWDTGLAALAMMEAGLEGDSPPIRGALDWLAERQILEAKGDWAVKRPNVRPGGWAFQYRNDHYPDVDDTAVVAAAMRRADPERYKDAIDRAEEWVKGVQSRNGGWGAFDVDNEHYELNNIPFADHGALLDPPEVDVSARCVSFLASLGRDTRDPTVQSALSYLRAEQEDDGSWFGRWGVNYIYGTWSALTALNAIGADLTAPEVRRAVDWLVSKQRPDGGWGEDCATYEHGVAWESKDSIPSQTAWALLGLMAAGEADHPAVEKGVKFLLDAPRKGARWTEDWYTGTGFPRVFYLRYHGYSAYFPLWALARYRRLLAKNDRRVEFAL